jgi:hypothetical protein
MAKVGVVDDDSILIRYSLCRFLGDNCSGWGKRSPKVL